jgi:hypothetical protein
MSQIMLELPGKIMYVKKATIDVVPANVEITLDGNLLHNDNGHCEFIDAVDEVTHSLTFNCPIDNLWIESMSVHHLLVDNKLEFTTPIYRWLFSVLDNK